MIISEEMDTRVLTAKAMGHSDLTIAAMFNLRVAAVRSIIVESQQLQLSFKNDALLRQSMPVNTGHTLLDMLRDHGIYTANQLNAALDSEEQFNKRIESMTSSQKLMLIQRLTKMVHNEYINSAGSSTDVQSRK